MCRSFRLSYKSVLASLSVLVLILMAAYFYTDPAFKWSISADGIPRSQKQLGLGFDGGLNIFEVLSKLGGGTEIITLVMVTLFVGRRPKFFYYLAAFTLEKGLGGILKLFIHAGRPYMTDMDPKVMGLDCSKTFGSPSGHSAASSLAFVILVLDVLHGSEEEFQKGQKLLTTTQRVKETPMPTFNWFVYLLIFISLLAWAILLPLSRFVLGAHSLDQCIFGSTFGVWQGLTMHFLFRDHII